MASTNPGAYSLDVALTNVAVMRKAPDLVGTQILPFFPAPRLTGNKVWRIDPKKSSLRVQADLRAPGAEALAIYSDTPDTPIDFDVPDHAMSDFLPDEMKAQYDTALRGELNKTQRLADKLWLNLESEILALLASGLTAGGTPSTKFDNYAGSTESANPIQFILSKYATIEAAIGATPNSIAMDIEVARKIVHNPYVRAYSVSVLPPNQVYAGIESWKAILRAVLGLDNIIIARGSWFNTAKKGQNESLSRMWGSNMALFWAEPPSVEYAGVGFTATFTGPGGGAANGMSVEVGRNAKAKSDDFIAHWYRQPKIINAGAGLWITNVLT